MKCEFFVKCGKEDNRTCFEDGGVYYSDGTMCGKYRELKGISMPNQGKVKIKEVSFERLRTFGNYENMKVGAVAEVEEGLDSSEALRQLREWVDKQITNQIADSELWALRYQKEHLLTEIEECKNRIKKMKEAVKTLDAFNIGG